MWEVLSGVLRGFANFCKHPRHRPPIKAEKIRAEGQKKPWTFGLVLLPASSSSVHFCRFGLERSWPLCRSQQRRVRAILNVLSKRIDRWFSCPSSLLFSLQWEMSGVFFLQIKLPLKKEFGFGFFSWSGSSEEVKRFSFLIWPCFSFQPICQLISVRCHLVNTFKDLFFC